MISLPSTSEPAIKVTYLVIKCRVHLLLKRKMLSVLKLNIIEMCSPHNPIV